MTSRTMTFCKAILLVIGLSTFATMVACSGGGHTTTTTNTITITATGGTPQSVAVGTAFAPLAATVKTNGTPTAGVSVTFTAPASGASGTFVNATATETDTTDSTGVATSTAFTANTTAGAYTVTASTTGAATPASFSLTNLAGAPTTITATSGTPQSAAVGMPFLSALGATVVDGDGNPVNGAVVTFTAVPVSGASGTFSNSTATEMDTTGANGVATSSTFTANAVPGAYTVTATVTGVATAATFILTNTVGTAGSITATGGTPQSTAVNKPFLTALSATVLDGSSNPISGASVTFTAVPVAGASGTFNNGTGTENDTTNASGVATSSTFTANATAGTYTVTATVSGVATPATFTLTNTAVTLAAGSYVFSLSGTDANGFYAVAGQFTVASGGVITGGEQDFRDGSGVADRDLISGTASTVVSSTDGNVQITLTVCNGLDCTSNDTSVGVAGVETLQASLVSTSKSLITEFDTSATASGELDSQAASPATPSGGYAFFASGVNSGGLPLSIGGIINVDLANGGIDGTGSVYDLNNGGSLFSDQTFQASSASLPDGSGRTAFTLNSTNNPPFITAKLVGYIIDVNRIALVEGFDQLGGVLGGFARAQAHTGGFNKASISGDSYVFGTAGADGNGPLQAAGVLTFNSDNSVTGNLSFNDFTTQAPSGGETIVAGATYVVDPTGTGRVTITGLTDVSAYFLYNYQFYLDGSGHAEVISMDPPIPPPGVPDVQGGIAFKQTTTALTAASISGNYALDATQVTLAGDEQDGVGTVLAGTGAFAGFLDVNETFVPTADLAVSGTFAVPSGTPPNGLFTGTIKDAVTGTSGNFNYYFVDNTRGVAIQIDNTQLTLGTFLLEQ